MSYSKIREIENIHEKTSDNCLPLPFCLPFTVTVSATLPLSYSLKHTFTLARFQTAGNSNQHLTPSVWPKQPAVVSTQFRFAFSVLRSDREKGET